jgi:predicted metal-dependent HD superfamily phosphohydrolase
VFAHIEDCLDKLASVLGLTPAELRILTYAFLWHDSIYDATRTDNEEESAKRARADLQSIGADPAEIDEVVRLILLTKSHLVEDGDRIGAIMVSIDLSILGAAPGRYRAYADAIRREYAHVPDADYRAGRTAVLRRLLQADPIYPDPGFRDIYEAQARDNMQQEIDLLVA